METSAFWGMIAFLGIIVVGILFALHEGNAIQRKEEEAERLAVLQEKERKEEEKRRAAEMREEEKERKRRERERVAAIEREQRAQAKDFEVKDKRMSKINSQLSNPASFRELCSAISCIDNLDSDEIRFLAEQAQLRYPAIFHFQQSGKDQCMIEYINKQIDAIRILALRPIGIDEFAAEAGKIIKPLESGYQELPKNAKNHYNAFAAELFGRLGDK